MGLSYVERFVYPRLNLYNVEHSSCYIKSLGASHIIGSPPRRFTLNPRQAKARDLTALSINNLYVGIFNS